MEIREQGDLRMNVMNMHWDFWIRKITYLPQSHPNAAFDPPVTKSTSCEITFKKLQYSFIVTILNDSPSLISSPCPRL